MDKPGELRALLEQVQAGKLTIDAALASGPEEPFSRAKFAGALKRGLQKAKSKAA